MINILPAVVASIASYALAQVLFVNCRFQLKPLICPLNWFNILFLLQMVLVPLVVVVTGPSTAFLPYLPSNLAISLALLMNGLAYLSFCTGVHLSRKRQSPVGIECSDDAVRSWFPSMWVIATYLLLGTAGIAMRFGTPRSFLDYFTDPASYLLGKDTGIGGSATLAEAASTFLMSFSTFGFILLWCRQAYQQRRQDRILSRVIAPISLICVTLTASLYNYNKAAIVIPFICVAAVMLKRGLSGKLLQVVGLATFAAALLIMIASYRLLVTPNGGIIAHEYDLTDMMDYLQDYGTAPQYLGFLIQSTDYMVNPSLGKVCLSSALSPVPIIGKAFREQSGNVIYANYLGRTDQPLTSVGELLLDFSVLGVILGFLALGTCASKLQNRFEESREPFEIYVLQFTSICLSYFIVCGIEEVAQLVLVFLWPVYCFIAFRLIEKKRILRRMIAIQP